MGLLHRDRTSAVAEIVEVTELQERMVLASSNDPTYRADNVQIRWRLRYRVTAPDGVQFEDTEELFLGQTIRPVVGIAINVTYRTKSGSHIRFDETGEHLQALRTAIAAATA